MNEFDRLELLIGSDNLNILKNTSVCVVGIGGVGSYAVEALARSGIGKLILVDKDNIDITNLNRQIHALNSTIGQSKVETMKRRILDINPNCEVITYQIFYNEETNDLLFNNNFDYLIDACDTITSKLCLIKECLKRKIPFISSMGAANKLDPTKFEINDISKTSYDPLAKIIRVTLKKDGISGEVPVVFSKEIPIKIASNSRNPIKGSIAFVPSTAGLICASYIINKIITR